VHIAGYMTPAAPTPTPNRLERRRLGNRAALLEAAIALFQAQGVRATKLEDICARADVSPRTFFNHFETREHLYRAIVLQRATQMAVMLDTRAASPEPFDTKLRALLAAIGTWLAAHPAYREMVREMLALAFTGEREGARILDTALVRFMAAAAGRGEVTDRHPPEVLADLLLGAITTALRRWCDDEDYDLAKGLRLAGSALSDLLATRRAGTARSMTTKRSRAR